MWPLSRKCVTSTLWACAVALLLGASGGAVRLLPWVLSPDVPLRVARPFAEALAAAAAETALLIGVPIGFALGSARFVERGEARALFALGVAPSGLMARTAPAALLCAALSLALGAWWDVDASSPGRIARGLIAQAEIACQEASRPRTAMVPMVGITWVCFPGSSPRVVGTLPDSGGQLWFTAEKVEPTLDLSSFALQRLHLQARRKPGWPTVRVTVKQAEVRGLSPWGRPTNLPGSVRAVVLAATQLASALATTWLILRLSVSGRGFAFVSGAVPGLVTLLVLRVLDRAEAGVPIYLCTPAAATLSTLLLFALGAVLPRSHIDRLLRR